MSTDLALSSDEMAIMNADREKMGNRFPTIPQIRLVNKDMKQAKEGTYFIEKRNGENVEVTSIGENPIIVILYRTYTYSYFTPEDGLIAWTSDIHGFGQMDEVTLYKKLNGKVEIDFEGSYPEFKAFAAQKYTTIDPVTGKPKKLLKFKTVLYVSYEGQVYKMFVSNASSSGVLDGLPSFDKAQPKSLQVFMDTCWKSKSLPYEFTVMLGSQYIESTKPYYIMTFSHAGNQLVDDLRNSIKLSQEAQKAIIMIDTARKNYNKKEDPLAHEGLQAEEVDPADLPF